MAHPSPDLRASRHLHRLRDYRSYHLYRQSRTPYPIQYNLSFYIQVGLVAAFIAAFFSLSKRKLDSRRRLSEDLTDSLENPINPMMNDQEINQK